MDFIMEHFFSNGYFSDSQCGFIKGRSTVLQLLKILDDWTNNLDQGKQIDVIYYILILKKHSIKFPIMYCFVNSRNIT